MVKTLQIDGFHGTSKVYANEILAGGYNSSKGDNHWIGDGVYLFVDGIGDGHVNAKDWAIYKAWDNKTKHNVYPYYAVIKSSVEVNEDEMLDMTTHDGVELFNYILDKCSVKLAEIGKQKTFIDGYVVNFGRDELGMRIAVVKANLYIQLKRSDRIQKIRRRTQNCTICAVADETTIKSNVIVETGRIE